MQIRRRVLRSHDRPLLRLGHSRRTRPLTRGLAATAVLSLLVVAAVAALPDEVRADEDQAGSPPSAVSGTTVSASEDITRDPGVDLSAHLSKEGNSFSLSGTKALAALGGRDGADLAAVAQAHRMTAEDLATSFTSDSTLGVTAEGRLVYADTFDPADIGGSAHDHGPDTGSEEISPGPDGTLPAPQGYSSSGVTEPSASSSTPQYPLSDTFRLHSRPDSPRKIHLDFDGHTFEAWDGWKIAGNTYCGFSLDADPLTFTADERRNIQEVWRIAAAHFDAFDVDVTTEDPGVDAIRMLGSTDPYYGVRVVIGGDAAMIAQAAPSATCKGSGFSGTVGYGYINAFGSPSHTAALALGQPSPTSTAWIVNHEVGHTLGLEHTFDGSQKEDQTYSNRTMSYTPTASMLTFSQAERVQASYHFWRPDPAAPTSASGRWQFLPSIRNDRVSAEPLRPGDHVEATLNLPFTPTPRVRPTGYYPITTTASATPVAAPAPDEDWYSLGSCPHLAVRVAASRPWAALDLMLSLRDANGTEIARHAPAGRFDAALSGAVGHEGPLYLVVSGSSPLEGGAEPADMRQVNGVYPAAHSSGTYALDLISCGDAPAPPSTLTATISASGATVVAWQRPTVLGAPDSPADPAVTGYDVALDGRRMITVGAETSSHTFPATPDAQRVRVRARSASGTSSWIETTTFLTGPISPVAVSAVKTSSGDVNLTITHDQRWLSQAGQWPASSMPTMRIGFGTGAYYGPLDPLTTAWNIPSTYAVPVGRTGEITLIRPGYPSVVTTYTVTAAPAAVLTPSAPTNLRLVPSTTSATLHWEQPRDEVSLLDSFLLHPPGGGTPITIDPDATSVRLPLEDWAVTNLAGATLRLEPIAHGQRTSSSAGTTFTVPSGLLPGVPTGVEIREDATGTRLIWDRYTQQSVSGELLGWKLTVGQQEVRLPASATSAQLAGFRTERTTRVHLSAVTTTGTGPARTVALRPAVD